jgi:hypothetical protein
VTFTSTSRAATSLSLPSEGQSQCFSALQAVTKIDRSNPDFELLKSSEDVRRATFDDWPVQASHIVHPHDLAKAGLFFTGQSDRVQCAFCRGILRNWTEGDKPLDEHRKHFPQCSFVRRQDTNHDHVDTPQGSEYTASVRSGGTAAVSLARSQPRHPEYADVNARIASFTYGRLPVGQKVEVLAAAGFYYVGPVDNVRCFHCDGGLKNWQVTDEPWTEHGRWFPRCPYLLANRDQRFVRSAQIPRNATLSDNLPADSVSRMPQFDITPNNVQYRIEPREIKARMDSPVVRAVIEMGYPRDLVRQTIERRLTTIGDDFPNVASLLEAVLEFEDHHSSVSASNATVSSLSMLVPMTAPTTAADTLHSASAPTFTSAVVAANLESTTESGQQTAAQKSKAKGKKKKKKGTANSNLSSDVERPTEEVVKLEEENRQLKEARTCRVCMDVEINTVFLPCGHLVCCDGCARSLQQCPICRTHIRGTVKTFLS